MDSLPNVETSVMILPTECKTKPKEADPKKKKKCCSLLLKALWTALTALFKIGGLAVIAYAIVFNSTWATWILAIVLFCGLIMITSADDDNSTENPLWSLEPWSVSVPSKADKVVLVCTLSEEPKPDSVPFTRVGRMVLDSELSPTEVVMLVKSPGGLPHVFGLVAAHIRRLIEAGIPVTACVDEVAASGGYMVACAASKIVVAPWATIGSVGVVGSALNYSKLLENIGIQSVKITSGKFKCPVDSMSPVTAEGLAHETEKAEELGVMFRAMVQTYRPGANAEKLGTADTWLGQQAVAIGLADVVQTSDAYLYELAKSNLVKVLSSKAPDETQAKSKLTSVMDALLRLR